MILNDDCHLKLRKLRDILYSYYWHVIWACSEWDVVVLIRRHILNPAHTRQCFTCGTVWDIGSDNATDINGIAGVRSNKRRPAAYTVDCNTVHQV